MSFTDNSGRSTPQPNVSSNGPSVSSVSNGQASKPMRPVQPMWPVQPNYADPAYQANQTLPPYQTYTPPLQPPHTLQSPRTVRTPLIRPTRGRIFAGVCKGLSNHLATPVSIVRIIFCATIWFPPTLVAYLFLWIFTPSSDNYTALLHDPSRTNSPEKFAISKGNKTINDAPQLTELRGAMRANSILVILVGMLMLAMLSFVTISQFNLSLDLAIIIFLGGFTALCTWIYFENSALRRNIWTLCSVLFILTLTIFAIYRHFKPYPHHTLYVLWLLSISAISLCLTLLPWITSTYHTLARERAEKEREEMRADIAAHLHDSVLQTLNLIQLNSDNPQMVASLAHTQERELRQWLYDDTPHAAQTLAAILKDVVAKLEDTFGKQVKVIIVGDVTADEQIIELTHATEQALTNAIRHGHTPISLYCEASASNVEVFVRDHGDGFDLGSIPEDRLGIRHSIVGRMERIGGTASIKSNKGWGTEVQLKLHLH